MRSKRLIKNLKKAIQQDYLYNQEELTFMKKQLKILEESILKTSNKPEGFGK
tara:strand:- start:240 stop:395 length:156 start_codon:yes stop_codon:yes gene_type:complete